MTQPITSGSVSSKGDLHARDVITGIQNNFTVIFRQPFEPPADLTRLRAAYLAYLRDGYRHLDMKGIMQVQQVTQQLPLAAVYVPLKAYAHQAAPDEMVGRVAGRLLALAGQGETGPDRPEAALGRQTTPQPIEEILKSEPAVVVLGDPGAGKSTLLKVMALALAEQDDGPLPIILPLNAYARQLQKGEINLGQFLGQYYATRQRKLSRVGELFEAALNDNQAVVLLDGLDEVQADRPYLVRLVQDFVAEYVPQPDDGRRTTDDQSEAVAGGQRPAVIPGNRIVVTSRIVGYDEAPLAGQHWRTHTLTDFNRADIEQFVGQWTLLFTISIQGDSELARQAAGREQRELLEAIFSRPSVERLATNPLMLTILALIKYTGVTLPEQRVKLYELYLQALIESWNRARSLDQYPVGPGMNYEETVQVLAPLALWLRQENPTAGLVSREQLEQWLTGYYHGEEWGLPRGQARQRGRAFLNGVEQYSNLLLERGERQYGFLHLTLEEMLAAKGIVQLADEDQDSALAIFESYLLDPAWHETLQLAVGVMGVLQQRPKAAGSILQRLLTLPTSDEAASRQIIFAGEALLDVGVTGIGRAAVQKVTATLVETKHSAACPIRTRRDAGNLLGRLGWTPEPEPGDLILAPASLSDHRLPDQSTTRPTDQPAGLDAFRFVPEAGVWFGKYPITNYQFARFIEDDGYNRREFWSDDGWAWRHGANPGVERIADKNLRKAYEEWLVERPAAKRDRPYWWEDRQWNSPLYPVVGVSWFEAEAYTRWLTNRMGEWANGQLARGKGDEVLTRLAAGELMVRLPQEAEWEAVMSGRGDYPWGGTFDFTCLNCAESWAGRDFANDEEWREWTETKEWREAGLTAVTTYPQGVSQAGVWDGSGNVWEWMVNPYRAGGDTMALRGGSWWWKGEDARASSRSNNHPDDFNHGNGFRVVVAPVF